MSESDPTLERALGRAWTDDRCWELLTRLTELPHRMGGSPAERRAAEIVRETFSNAGLEDVQLQEFPMQYWERGTTEFAVLSEASEADDGPDSRAIPDRSFEAIALPYSPAGDVEGPLVDVGYGTPTELEAVDLQGAIAVASTTTPRDQRFVHRMEKFGHAVAAGAEAFVFANHVPGQLPPTGALQFDAEAAVPGVGVSAETHDWLIDYAERGARARIRVDASTEDGSSRNVHGVFGPETDEEVLVVAHYDAHDITEGALDNGCGIATVAGATAILSALEADLDCRVRIAGVGCEEIGLLGAEAMADELDLESVRAVVNVDGAGRFRNLRALSHGSKTLEELAEDVTTAAGQPIVHEPDPHPFSDHWPFLRAGVPALQLHSEPPEGGERGRGWTHTTADTRDKVDRRNLREHAMLTALLVRELTRTEVPRVDTADLQGRLREQEYEPGMRAAEIWPDAWD
ncbi:peptidase M28 [Haloterrigena turkmenica DSM 5511]|uniref:Carboxypeptidase Q n=1 Tax=Haloterrigena turkmenica (strain ATCC 51198 / DSM 5511 / JCM 9101 / NCIMB 13204 / VKM B-1734 / 4k) TaxID=543526 RepID=D2RPS9_HALTV|nr:M28 family metallopeptidase [Haloterrigena turkmenica]ADB62231.1 peptidase M28 [Haloterrigena turkmenica DSM 5511]